MDKLPYEINSIIFSYLFECKKNQDYIINKETLNIFKDITSDCEKIFVFRKNICKKCDKKTIMYLRLMMNNLIPSF